MPSSSLSRLLFIAGLALACSGPARAADDSPAPKKLASVEGITEYELANGCRVLLYPDQSRPKVTINMTVLVGSRHEGYGETGMAHLLEHMLFKGTPDHSTIPKALQDHGAQFNGTTSSDRTNYFETVTAGDENLEFFIRMEADRLINSFVKKEDLLSEMTVVRNEFERGENSPTSILYQRIASAAYDWHNYGKSTIGNRSDIERVPIENLRAFYQRFYQPDNVVVIIAGQFDETKALALVQKYFGAIPRPKRKLNATYTEEPTQDGERSVTLRRVGDVGAVGSAYHIPSGPHADFAPLQLLASILGTQPSGRLYKALVETKMATDVGAFAGPEHDPGLLITEAEVRESKTLDEVRNVMLSVNEGIGEKGVTEEEVNRAKQQFLKARELASTDTSRFAVTLSEWVAQGDWRLYFLHRDRIEKVTPKQIQEVAAKYLVPSNRTVGTFIPTEKPLRATVPETPDIAALVENYKGRAAISAGEAFEATPANVEARVKRQELTKGIQLSYLTKKTRGEDVYVSLTLHFGNAENLKGYETAAALLPELLVRGTKKLTYQQLRDELDKLNSTLHAAAGSRGWAGTDPGLGNIDFLIHTKRGNLPAVLEILRQVLREPALPADQFEILKRERLAAMEQMRNEPAALASRALQRQVSTFGKDDVRYVPTIPESLERTSAVTRDQVFELYRDFLGGQAGEIGIVGDFDPDVCLPLLKATFDDWQAPKAYARIVMPAPTPSAGAQQKIETPDKANANYFRGLLFPLRDDDPDYPALVIANYIFGGGSLASRLGTRVRQQEGLSYNVGSSLSVSSFDPRSGLLIMAICNPRNITKVETAISEEYDRLLKDGVTEDEVAKAKQGYLQSQRVRRAAEDNLAGLLSDLAFEGRTMAYYADQEQKIEALTPKEIAAAVRKHIGLAKPVIITAGDFATQPVEKDK